MEAAFRGKQIDRTSQDFMSRFGQGGGGGAPLRDRNGNLIGSRKPHQSEVATLGQDQLRQLQKEQYQRDLKQQIDQKKHLQEQEKIRRIKLEQDEEIRVNQELEQINKREQSQIRNERGYRHAKVATPLPVQQVPLVTPQQSLPKALYNDSFLSMYKYRHEHQENEGLRRVQDKLRNQLDLLKQEAKSMKDLNNQITLDITKLIEQSANARKVSIPQFNTIPNKTVIKQEVKRQWSHAEYSDRIQFPRLGLQTTLPNITNSQMSIKIESTRVPIHQTYNEPSAPEDSYFQGFMQNINEISSINQRFQNNIQQKSNKTFLRHIPHKPPKPQQTLRQESQKLLIPEFSEQIQYQFQPYSSEVQPSQPGSPSYEPDIEFKPKKESARPLFQERIDENPTSFKQTTQFVYLSESEEVEGESMFITASVPKDRGPKMVLQSNH